MPTMSTYLYLECRDHTPPLRSFDEVGQHLYDLPRIRREIAQRDEIAAATALGFTTADGYFTNNAARFLSQHHQCDIGIRDEYGREHPIGQEEQ